MQGSSPSTQDEAHYDIGGLRSCTLSQGDANLLIDLDENAIAKCGSIIGTIPM